MLVHFLKNEVPVFHKKIDTEEIHHIQTGDLLDPLVALPHRNKELLDIFFIDRFDIEKSQDPNMVIELEVEGGTYPYFSGGHILSSTSNYPGSIFRAA